MMTGETKLMTLQSVQSHCLVQCRPGFYLVKMKDLNTAISQGQEISIITVIACVIGKVISINRSSSFI